MPKIRNNSTNAQSCLAAVIGSPFFAVARINFAVNNYNSAVVGNNLAVASVIKAVARINLQLAIITPQ